MLYGMATLWLTRHYQVKSDQDILLSSTLLSKYGHFLLPNKLAGDSNLRLQNGSTQTKNVDSLGFMITKYENTVTKLNTHLAKLHLILPYIQPVVGLLCHFVPSRLLVLCSHIFTTSIQHLDNCGCIISIPHKALTDKLIANHTQ